MKPDVRLTHAAGAFAVMLIGKEVVFMTKFLYLLSAAAVALVLSACTVTVSNGDSVDPDPVDKDRSTSVYTGGDLAAADTADGMTLAAGESVLYRVNVSTTSRDALYLYLNAELDLYVYLEQGSTSPYATSSSENFFAGGTAGLNVSTAGGALSTTDVSASLACPGSCVILPSGASDPVFVRVRNTSSVNQSFSFYAVLRDFEDTSEATSGLDLLPVGMTTGALETLDDVDGYDISEGGTLLFDATLDSGIAFEAEIRDPLEPGSSPRTLSSGQSAEVLIGEEVRVYAVNDRAAVAGKSLYFLTLE